METIQAIQSEIDENKLNLSNDLYLKFNNFLKSIYDKLDNYDSINWDNVYAIKILSNHNENKIKIDGSYEFITHSYIGESVIWLDNEYLYKSIIKNIKNKSKPQQPFLFVPYKKYIDKIIFIEPKEEVIIDDIKYNNDDEDIIEQKLKIVLKYNSQVIVDIKKITKEEFLNNLNINENENE